MSAHNIFFAGGRLRAAWRLALFIAVAAACVYAGYLVAGSLVAAFPSLETYGVIDALPLPAGLLAAHAIMLRWADPHPWSFAGLGHAAAAPRFVAGGAALGALAIAAPTGVLLLARQYVLVPAADGDWLAATARATAILVPAALWEELFFRGYPLAVLREAAGWKAALAATAFAFGAAHLQNPGATAESILVVILAGYFLGLVRLATGSLYAAWAAHFAWNWVMACGFHVAVSGNPFERPDYALVPRGPAWLTGGSWGPEGGFAAALSVSFAALWLYGRYLKPSGAPRNA